MITLYSGLVVKQPLVESLIPAFTAATGVPVETTFEPTTILLERIAAGERPDLVLGVAVSLGDLAERGVLDTATVTEIAVSAIGFARSPSTPAPADDAAATFLDYLVTNVPVAYALAGASGIHFVEQLRQRDLLDTINADAVQLPSGLTAEAVLDGRANVAIQQVSELRSVPGDLIVAPIPHELQQYGRFSVAARPGAPEAAQRFIEFLTTQQATDAFAAVGLGRP